MSAMINVPSSASVVDLLSEDCSLRVPAGVSTETLGVLQSLGIKALSQIQREALPPALSGSDVIAKGRTGTGKTVAFLAPTVEALSRRARESPGAIRAVVLSHTRELASQVLTNAARFADPHGLTARLVTGGKSIEWDREQLGAAKALPIDVLVATPGRLAEHVAKTDGFAARIAACEVVVLDECDELLGDGGFAKTVLDLLASMTRADRQTLCFSATLPAKLETMLARVTRVDALVRVDCVGTASAADESGGAGDADDAAAAAEDIAAATPSASSAAPVAQSFAVLPSSGAALRAVHAVVSRELAANPTGAKVVVFFSTARMTQFAAAALPFGAGVDVFEIHSKKKQAARDLAADAFRAATTNAVLVTSDVSARGVDYPDVSLVVQCEAPTSTQQYVHRVGRTGRGAGARGATVLLLHAFEKAFLTDLAAAKVPGVELADASADVGALLSAQPAADVAALAAAAAAVDAELATATYSAFLSHFVQQKKMTRLSKDALVARANEVAADALGRGSGDERVPRLDGDFARSVGLGGVAGVFLTVSEGGAADEGGGGGGGGGSGGAKKPATKAEKEAEAAAAKAAKAAEKQAKADAIRAEKIAAGLKAKADAAAKRAAASE